MKKPESLRGHGIRPVSPVSSGTGARNSSGIEGLRRPTSSGWDARRRPSPSPERAGLYCAETGRARGSRRGRPASSWIRPVSRSLERAGLLAGGNALNLVALFFMPLILTRILSKELFGIYNQATLMGNILYPIFTAGIAASVYYFHASLEPARRPALIVQSVAWFFF